MSVFEFTSHYVSINSLPPVVKPACCANLHPTMYLLIRIAHPAPVIEFNKFTSHYVSINSDT